MKMQEYGYKERTLKTREMNIAELKISILQYCKEKHYNFCKIRLMNISCGEVEVFDTALDFAVAEFNDCWEITVMKISECMIYNDELECSEVTLIIVIEDNEI